MKNEEKTKYLNLNNVQIIYHYGLRNNENKVSAFFLNKKQLYQISKFQTHTMPY